MNFKHNCDIESIEMIQNKQNPLDRWSPVVGVETLALLDHLGLPYESRQVLVDEAVSVLSKSVPINVPNETLTGLVVGYVQSGKTMSFTTVAALARDNGYQMVIVIAGTSQPLYNQSLERLESDLRLKSRRDRKWLLLPNPRVGDVPNIAGKLADWRDKEATESERQTVLITVMKHHSRLKQLAATLERLDLENVQALIIDDEADQAGLNNEVRDGTESTTYTRILAVRSKLPHHTFLQYTATPQAPLLINIIDQLSPRFADVLTPGPEYVGGKEFFADNANLICTIPNDEIPSRANRLLEPPPTLLRAMQLYFIGVASGRITDNGEGNRSMMVHPSQETIKHAVYSTWVRSIKDAWVVLLGLPDNDPDRTDLINQFKKAYDSIGITATALPPFTQLAPSLLRSMRNTLVTEINSAGGKTPTIDWKASYAHILVGGQAMDRGFTVEGLTVTYMPRGIGVGNADTVQQRARFFGYKRKYIGFCRIFLESNAALNYKRYVEHEEDVRSRLQTHQETGLPMSEWKRAFLLENALRPTRDSVLGLDYMRGNYNDRWYTQRAPHDSTEASISNASVVSLFRSQLVLSVDGGNALRTEMQKHLVNSCVPVKFILENLLIPFRATYAPDSQRLTGILIQAQKYVEDYPDAVGTVYVMSCGVPRLRTVGNNGEIPQLLQGANPGTDPVYHGDRELHEKSALTVQIHYLDVAEADNTYTNVPALAIWVPEAMAAGWIVQQEHG